MKEYIANPRESFVSKMYARCTQRIKYDLSVPYKHKYKHYFTIDMVYKKLSIRAKLTTE